MERGGGRKCVASQEFGEDIKEGGEENCFR